jgi:tetratricopeptide (TPR) repeat protein/tRNA A-37 threonylcarbamoyl transferase component Bud32
MPQRLGKYHVLERLAEGGMAEVFKVKTVGIAGFEKVQALKRVRPELARDPRFQRSFVDEARIAVALNHRNIVQVFEFGKVSDELVLAMELIEGKNLRETLDAASRRGVKIPVALAAHVLGEVATGLDYAHRKTDGGGAPLGIVHCDVSPPNIALSFEGYVKILDFGVARARFAAELAGRVRGKPRYMAPEQARGEAPTPATDVFALGLVGVELLTGAPVFVPTDVSAMLAAIRAFPGLAPGRLPASVPGPLAAALIRALTPNPGGRGSAKDLAAACAQTVRILDRGVGSRALSRLLAELFPGAGGERAPALVDVEEAATAGDSGETTGAGETTARRAARTGGPGEAPTGPGEGEDSLAHAVADPSPTAPDHPVVSAAALIGADQVPAHDTPVALPALTGLGEKRRVVVACAQLSGGDAEDRRVLRRVLADLAYKRGAAVQADEVDWVLATFGLDAAGEDELVHAARFGLEALEAIAAAREPPVPLAEPGAVEVRLGIHQGVGARLRAGARPEISGEAIADAKALALSAASQAAVVSGPPGRLATLVYRFAPLAPLGLRGRRVRRFALVGRAAGRGGAPVVPEPQTPLLGRDAEFERLLGAFDLAMREDRRVTVGLVGAAGAGKTRLVAELCRRVAGERPLVLATASTPGGRETPYALALQFFAAGLALPAERGAAGRARLLDRFAAVLKQRGVALGEADDVLASLEHALELRDGVAPAAEDTSANLRDRMVAAIATLRALHRGQRPRLTIIEDWHWADGASADTIRLALTGRPPAGAELVLVTARPPEPGPRGEPRAAALPSGCEQVITLGELDLAARTALVEARLGPAAEPAEVAAIVRRGGGNPLFLEELARAAQALGGLALPESLRGVLLAQVDRLPPAAKAALQHAAVLGPVFRRGVLEALVGRGLGRALAVLEAAEILGDSADRADVDAEVGDTAFRHGLLQEVVYASLPSSARRETHRRAGLLLAARLDAGRPESPAAIAYHLELGGEPAKAAEYHLRAARVYHAAHDERFAELAFTRALELGHPRRAEALAGREQARANLGDHVGQKQDLDALLALAADAPRRRAAVFVRIAGRHLRLGEYAAAVAATRAAEHAADQAGDERLRGEALRVRDEASERKADFGPALAASSGALEIFQRIGADNEAIRASLDIGRIHLMSARFDEALATFLPALERVRRLGDQWLERIVSENLAVIQVRRKAFAEALAAAQRALAICRRFGDRAHEGDNCSVMSMILLELGLYDEAREWAARGLAIHAETNSRWSRADALVYAAHGETLAGDPALGLSWLEQAIALATAIGAKYVLANAKNQISAALVRRHVLGDVGRAEREANEAAWLGREAELPSIEIQGLCRAAQARFEAGDGSGARALSQSAVERLDQVRSIEWSEEEILWTHYRILRQQGDAMAGGFLARAYLGLMAKLDRIVDRRWHAAFGAIELHRQIIAERARWTSGPRGGSS